ncbi:MAG TPA: inositol monophosphatase [Alphaproteobacteria bacterium]|nr:inositol monophosphatase [Alphaproteobacteria bacterium]
MKQIEEQIETEAQRMHLENLIIGMARQTGRYIKKNALDIKNTKWKEIDDPVTNLDKGAERKIKNELKKHIIANYYGEEFGIEDNGSNINIYTDPIDGTKSFIRGEYMSSLSIAADHNGELFIGVVDDFMKGLTYYATSKGAYIKSARTIKELPNINLEFSKPTVSFGWDIKIDKDVEKKINKRRQIGSIALAMAQLASGSYDALVMKPYQKKGVTDTCDIAAGYYIMKQAGIEILDYHGKTFDYRDPGQGIIAYRKGKGIEQILSKDLHYILQRNDSNPSPAYRPDDNFKFGQKGECKEY